MPVSSLTISARCLPRIATGLTLLWALAGCGYKGPLYMPPPPPPNASLTKPPVLTTPTPDQSNAPAQATPVK
jgi:predicted small lipoprotein YifL